MKTRYKVLLTVLVLWTFVSGVNFGQQLRAQQPAKPGLFELKSPNGKYHVSIVAADEGAYIVLRGPGHRKTQLAFCDNPNETGLHLAEDKLAGNK
jgi:hypothetical protein